MAKNDQKSENPSRFWVKTDQNFGSKWKNGRCQKIEKICLMKSSSLRAHEKNEVLFAPRLKKNFMVENFFSAF